MISREYKLNNLVRFALYYKRNLAISPRIYGYQVLGFIPFRICKFDNSRSKQQVFVTMSLTEADLGLLQQLEAVNYYHKDLHLRCCSSVRSASDSNRH